MKNLYVLSFLFLGVFQSANAQTASQYYFQSKTGVSLENLTGATTLFSAGKDDVISPSLDFFSFTYAGTTYNQFSVTEDGVLVLGTATYTPYAYDDYFLQYPALSGQTPVYTVLLPWAEDLLTGTDGSVSYKITGVAPARKLVVDFKVRSSEDLEEGYNKNFQVWLFEGSNKVQFVYGNGSSAWYNNANIGIGSSSTDYSSINSATHARSTTEKARNTAWPANGTAYVFSPVAIEETNNNNTTPMSAALSMSPEYPVAGQERNTIYLGYGTQSVKLNTVVSGGNAGYSYAWSPATGLSSTTAEAPVASPAVTTTYTVAITDANGSTVTKAITVYVNDPRYGDKFKVCKLGKTTICISVEAVNVQLSGGATLGECRLALSTAGAAVAAPELTSRLEPETAVTAAGGVAVYPNPSAGALTVRLPGAAQRTSVSVYDVNGKLLLQKTAEAGQRTLPLDLAGKAKGIYLVRIANNSNVWTSNVVVK